MIHFLTLLWISHSVLAASPGGSGVKKTVLVDRIENRYIEMPSEDPNSAFRIYGENIYSGLVAELQKQAIVLEKGSRIPDKGRAVMASKSNADPDPCLVEEQPQASASIRIRIDELSFVTGSRGEKLLYGFKRSQENEFNAGINFENRNEFPLTLDPRSKKIPKYFGEVFNDHGGLTTGLDLGHEFNFDAIIASANLKHMQYKASLGLFVEIETMSGKKIVRQITVSGRGFYYDLSASLAYQGSEYTLGVMIARKTALKQAFDRVIPQAVQSIVDELENIPLKTILARKCGESWLISGGKNLNLSQGQRFYDYTQWLSRMSPQEYIVEKVYETTAKVKAVFAGRAEEAGHLLVSLNSGEVPPPQPATNGMALASSAEGINAIDAKASNVDVGNQNFSLPKVLAGFVEGFFSRLWKAAKGLVTLPYRIWRYAQYDQKFKGGELWQLEFKQAFKLLQTSQNSKHLFAQGVNFAWAQCDVYYRQRKERDPSFNAPYTCLGSNRIIVAVIDTGIDYNHQELRRNIFFDGKRSTPGWDFISGDPRPYDDLAHGTEVASLIAGGGSKTIGIAPLTTLMPVKAFSPYGITSSASLYSAFEYAIKNGAKVIVAAWGTNVRSKALERAVRLAYENGVLVVAPAKVEGLKSDAAIYPAAFGRDFQNVISVGDAVTAPSAQVQVAQPRGGYKTRSAESLATGWVAGSLAWLWAQCPSANPIQIGQALSSQLTEIKGISLGKSLDYLNRICK